MQIAVILVSWIFHVEAVEKHQTSAVHDVCDLLTSLSVKDQMVVH